MKDNIREWIKIIPADIRAEFMAKLQKCENKESILGLAVEYKLPVTDEMATVIAERLTTPHILSEEDLSLIAGGTITMPGDLNRIDAEAFCGE